MNGLDMTDQEWYQQILDILLEALGPLGLKRFMAFREEAMGDQAAERHPWVDAMEQETLARGMQALQPPTPAPLLPPVQGGSPEATPGEVATSAACTSSEKREVAAPWPDSQTHRAVKEQPDRLSQLTDCEVHRLGLEAVSKAWGSLGIFQLSLLGSPGTGNYTLERRKWLSQISKEEFLAQIYAAREAQPRGEEE